jgi:hypothetical protein
MAYKLINVKPPSRGRGTGVGTWLKYSEVKLEGVFEPNTSRVEPNTPRVVCENYVIKQEQC